MSAAAIRVECPRCGIWFTGAPNSKLCRDCRDVLKPAERTVWTRYGTRQRDDSDS